MSLPLLIAWMVGITIAGWLFGGLVLWFACRVFRVRSVGYWRALGALVSALVILGISWAALTWLQRLEHSVVVGLFIVLVGSALATITMRRVLRTSTRRTLLVGTFTFAGLLGLNLAAASATKAFVCEGFVVPTGSMAPTIHGLHASARCSVCGFSIARGIDAYDRRQAQTGAIGQLDLRCPNCDARADRLPGARVANPEGGDHILVLKPPLGLPSHARFPRRWDLVVFRDPMDGRTALVTRLVGIPGEVVEIIDGDVYAASVDKLKQEGFPLDDWDRLREDVYSLGHGVSLEAADIEDRYRRLNEKLLPHLEIQRKVLQAPEAQEALWVNVYNHDYAPRVPDPSHRSSEPIRPVGWYPEDAEAATVWTATRGEITASSSSSPHPRYIRFDGKPIDDLSGYSPGRAAGGTDRVGDVRLRFAWRPLSEAGTLVLEMNRDEDVFAANIGSDGFVSVTARRPWGDQLVATSRLQPFTAGRAIHVEFMVVDYLVRLRMDGCTVVESTDGQYRPDLSRFQGGLQARQGERRETRVRIGARNLQCRLTHLVLERDVYYTDADLMPELSAPVNPYAGMRGWGSFGRPIMLRLRRRTNGTVLPAEYFVLGDNSRLARDSRVWWQIGPRLAHLGNEYQIGTVPDDHLIGLARWTYFPLARARRLN